MSESKISMSFPRDYYLECAEEFEGNRIDCVDQELSEFNYDEEDLAYELAYTRYTLAREELELEHLRAQVRELVQERDKMESALKKMINIDIINDYIYGEDRINEINKRFDRMMREA